MLEIRIQSHFPKILAFLEGFGAGYVKMLLILIFQGLGAGALTQAFFQRSRKAWLLLTIFTNSFSFSSSLFFWTEETRENNNQSLGQKSCLFARSFQRIQSRISKTNDTYHANFFSLQMHLCHHLILKIICTYIS